MFSRLLPTATVAAAALAAPAFAGSLDDAIVTPAPVVPVVAPAPVIAPVSDWTGFYVGGQLSFGRIHSDDFEEEGEGRLNGVHAGYLRDFGRIVVGAELEHDWGNIALEDLDVDVDRVLRAKLRVGYDAGRVLPYLTGGYARASLSGAFDEDVDGYFYGLGVEYRVTERFSTGVEIMRHTFDDIDGTDISANVDTIGIRGTFRF